MHGSVRAGCLAVCTAISIGCGQGGQGSGVAPPGIVISPVSISLVPGALAQFTATVPDKTHIAVTWSVSEGAKGGTIDAEGRYTAPGNEGLYHVVATAQGEPNRSATAAISVAAPPIGVSIDPGAASVEGGGTARFTATVTGTSDTTVIWSADGGTVDQSGLYTAPTTAGTFHLTATSRADPSRSATAVVSVEAIAIEISPRTITLTTDSVQQFTARVSGSRDARVSWTVLEGPVGGSIDVAGTYTAPPLAGIFHVAAAGVAHPNIVDTAVVTVARPAGVSVSIVPRTSTVQPGMTTRLTATVTGATDPRVVWTADGGRIRQDGLYTAPQTEGTYHVTAQSLADSSKIAVAALHVSRSSDVILPIAPDQVTVEVGGLVVFRAHLPGTPDSDVVWSIQEGAAGGSIDSLGQYTAPGDHEGVYHVIATSRSDPNKTATATVTVQRYDLVDSGGNVSASTRTFALWWGDPNAFPPDARTVLESLLTGLDGSAYLAVADQYLRGARATTSFGGSFFDASAPPADNPTEAAIADQACRALEANGIAPRAGDLVFVVSSVFPPGNIPFCAWHYWGSCHGENVLVVYLPNPKGTSCGRMASGCNTFSQEATAVGTFAAHEFMEAITDPFITAWKDQLGQEIGDKCFGLAACVPLATGSLQLQPVYSNALHACVQR